MEQKASVLENLADVRAMIKRHKRNDTLFAGIGLLCLMLGLITLMLLFWQLIADGYPKFNIDFFD